MAFLLKSKDCVHFVERFYLVTSLVIKPSGMMQLSHAIKTTTTMLKGFCILRFKVIQSHALIVKLIVAKIVINCYESQSIRMCSELKGISISSMQQLLCFITKNYQTSNPKQSNETNSDVMARILFIYAKITPQIGYLQGMNELVAILFYCMSNFEAPTPEQDTFYCFLHLMAEAADAFIKPFDNSQTGIYAKVNEFEKILNQTEPKVAEYLKGLKIKPIYYSLRWIMLIMTQEFDIYDTLQIWDAVFSHPRKLYFLNFICVAIIKMLKSKILTLGYSDVLKTLQKFDLNPSLIIEKAKKVYTKFTKEEFPKFLLF